MERLVARRIIADKYRLDRPLAAGGMGSVWAAWNTHLDVPVAVKFMAAPLTVSQDLVARFEREARAAAQLRSPHVVQIFEHGIDGDVPFIVMELLEGEDLGTRMRRRGRLPLAETAEIVAGVCKALRRAHAMGIVHRDLKPANVFLARSGDEDDEEEIVKVLDFGVVKSLAEAVESGVTKTGELIGTPSYMSPEQARNTKRVDHRSDLWSLGIIAYRALTATLPFPDDEGLDRLMRICVEPIPPPSSVCGDIGPEVDAFFARALAIDPDARFQTAREMADAILALAGVPVSARSDSRSSISDGGPPSSSVYTAHAYVYTQAPDAEETAPPPARRSSVPGAITTVKTPGRKAPLFPYAPELRPAGTRPSIPGAAEGATRVSGPGPAPAEEAPPERPRVSIVTGALADGSGPLPPISRGDLDTLDSAGLTRAPGTGGRLASPPRVAVGAGLALLAAMMSAALVMMRGGSGDAAVPAASAGPATLLFATGSVPAEPVAPPPIASAAPTASASAAPAVSVAPAAPSAAPGAAGAPSSSAGALAAPARSGGSAAPPPRPPRRARPAPAHREGGIGRGPTY